jgi:serine phosphatase RsbU (regulator of sigma subunit)
MKTERPLEAIQHYAVDIIDAVREPLLILDTALRVRFANRAFYRMFLVTPQETENRLIYELGNGQWDIPDLRTLLEDVVPKAFELNDFELDHVFPAIGRRVMLLNARKVRAGNDGELLVLAMEDITIRRRAQTDLEEYSRSLERARERINRDLEWARVVQRGLLPQQVPEVGGYEFFKYYEAAFQVGGDYYDFIPLPGQRVAMLLGDVAGKGVMAALLMAKLTADARYCVLTEPDLAAAMFKLNSLTIQSGFTDRFVSMLAAVLDPVSHTVTFVNAGHLPPLLFDCATRSVNAAVSSDVSGLPLGIVEGSTYECIKVCLQPGDTLVAFTDGVTEAMNPQGTQLQTQGVYAAMQGKNCSPRALGEHVVKAVNQFSAGRSQQDDIAIVCFGRTR